MDKQPRENTEFQTRITAATDIKKSVVEPNKMQAVRLQWKMNHQTGERVIKLCKSKKSDIVRVKVRVSSYPYLPTFGPSKKMDIYYSTTGAGEHSRPSSSTHLIEWIATALEKSASENREATDRCLASLTKVSISSI